MMSLILWPHLTPGCQERKGEAQVSFLFLRAGSHCPHTSLPCLNFLSSCGSDFSPTLLLLDS